MIKCAFCGTENMDNLLFCEWCGQRLASDSIENMFTPLVANEGKAVTISTEQKEDIKKTTETRVFKPKVGGLYDGKVTRIYTLGAFVELAPGRGGIIHISKLADYKVKKVEDVVHIGDIVWVKIIEIDEDGRINLSLKDALHEIEVNSQKGIAVPHTYIEAENYDEADVFKPKVGGLYDGKVTRIYTFGAFVELAPERGGIIFTSELADNKVEKVEDVVHIGDMVRVKIIEIDKDGRIICSLKDALNEIRNK